MRRPLCRFSYFHRNANLPIGVEFVYMPEAGLACRSRLISARYVVVPEQRSLCRTEHPRRGEIFHHLRVAG